MSEKKEGRMTAPAPDTSSRMVKATVYDVHFQASKHETGDDAKWLHAVADLLAAVGAERDRARRDLADAPHPDECHGWVPVSYDGREDWVDEARCNCWKKDL